MTAFDARRGLWACALTFAIAVVVSPRAAAAAEPVPTGTNGTSSVVKVHLDQAKVLKLPERTSTLVVGNPLIADAVVQPGGTVVVTAKSYGATNLVALDRTGATLMETPIQVAAPNDYVLVTVYKGVERESYSCAPDCGRRIAVGDTPTYFTANLTQVGTVNAMALQQPK